MELRIKHFHLIVFLLLIILILPNCSGINLPSNCKQKVRIVYAVMPFHNDNYYCNKNIESKLTDLCYTIFDGEQLLKEYCLQINKQVADITVDEICDYANRRGVDYLIFGEVEIVWMDGMRPKDLAIVTAEQGRSTEEDMYHIITGNYAKLDCYSINTNSKDKRNILTNYNVKKVEHGMPSMMSGSNK